MIRYGVNGFGFGFVCDSISNEASCWLIGGSTNLPFVMRTSLLSCSNELRCISRYTAHQNRIESRELMCIHDSLNSFLKLQSLNAMDQ
jgi:hypothetical protein